MHDVSERTGPFGEALSSETYRSGLQAAARDALEAIASHRRGEVDALLTCRSIVNDPYLREITPFDLLRGFIAADAQFDLDLDPGRSHLFEPADWIELCAERDVYFASAEGSIVRDCDVLAAHLEQWQRDNPPHSSNG